MSTDLDAQVPAKITLAEFPYKPRDIPKGLVSSLSLYIEGPAFHEPIEPIEMLFRSRKKPLGDGAWFDTDSYGFSALHFHLLGTRLQHEVNYNYAVEMERGVFPWQEKPGRSDFPQLQEGLQLRLRPWYQKEWKDYTVTQTCYAWQTIAPSRKAYLLRVRDGILQPG